MELNHETVNTPVRNAASVVLLRQGNAGLQVLLVQRHGLSDVLGGAYVFPGGKVDTDDAQDDILQRLDEPAPSLHQRLGEPALEPGPAAAVYVAALRELFEEAGVLLTATDGATGRGRPGDLQRVGDVATLLREGHRFAEAVALAGLRLGPSALAPWTRWITPRTPAVMRKRFDTRFLLAELPEGQDARHDEREAIDSIWLSPRDALAQYQAEAIDLAPPQIMSLVHLARYASVAEALADAASRPPPLIEPEPFEHDGTRVLTYPGDERHSVRERRMPGPTRLLYRGGRFFPQDGFDALWR